MTLRLDGSVTVGSFVIECDLTVDRGESVALVGPNGAGKSTVLRAIAGLASLSTGSIRFGDRVWDDPVADRLVPACDRSVGVVFQDYALFDHLSALDNVAFGPRARGVDRRSSNERAGSLLDALDLSAVAGRRPAELSGGQAQRVAIARALATEPDVVLLDEPLAALDATSRAAVRRLLPEWLERGSGRRSAARVIVTHDPVDADALADRVVVLEGGRVTQRGTVFELAARPRSPYVADLMGTNLLHGELTGDRFAVAAGDGETYLVVGAHAAADGSAVAAIRPAAVALHRHRPEGSPRNVWVTTVRSIDRSPDRLRVCLDAPLSLVAEITEAGLAALGVDRGDTVWASVKASEISVVDGA